MFGGVGLLLNGNLLVGVRKHRVGRRRVTLAGTFPTAPLR
jgi:hypothetical protein